MEVVGRYPTIEEVEELAVNAEAPVWLPTRPAMEQFTDSIRNQLSILREANNLLYFC